MILCCSYAREWHEKLRELRGRVEDLALCTAVGLTYGHSHIVFCDTLSSTEFQVDHTDRQTLMGNDKLLVYSIFISKLDKTDLRTCRAASSQLKNKKYNLT